MNYARYLTLHIYKQSEFTDCKIGLVDIVSARVRVEISGEDSRTIVRMSVPLIQSEIQFHHNELQLNTGTRRLSPSNRSRRFYNLSYFRVRDPMRYDAKLDYALGMFERNSDNCDDFKIWVGQE